MYKKIETVFGVYNKGIKRMSDGACIPFDPANTDYQQFKVNVKAGAELQDAEGNPMSQEAAIEFVRGLP